MLIWKGAGLLVLAIGLGTLVVTQLILGPLYQQGWAKIVGLGIAGAICWFLGKRLNRHASNHHLFFIPMEYWGIVLPVLGVALSFVYADP